MAESFTCPRSAARALLTTEEAKLTRKAGAFLGQVIADPAPLSEAQRKWLDGLLERAALPALVQEAGR